MNPKNRDVCKQERRTQRRKKDPNQRNEYKLDVQQWKKAVIKMQVDHNNRL